MEGKIQTIATVAFKDIFPDEERHSMAELLYAIPTKTILTITAHFMAQIHGKEDDFELQKEIVFRWINQQDDRTSDYILNKFNELIDKLGAKINFFNNISSLYFYQEVFSNSNEEEDRDLTAEEELRLLKAYLIVSECWTEKEVEHLKQRPTTDDQIVSYVLPFQMAHNEIQSFKDFRAQLIKAIYFFRFLILGVEPGRAPYTTQ